MMVLPVGIEPTSHPPQGRILSTKLWEHGLEYILQKQNIEDQKTARAVLISV